MLYFDYDVSLRKHSIYKRKIFLSGKPGAGKSTVFKRCIKLLREMSYSVGGISTPEIRRRGQRVGFSVVDITTDKMEVLASINIKSTYRVGRYGINLQGFESVALPAIEHAKKNCDVVCIDEIGRMELFSEPFKKKMKQLIKEPKPLFAVLHRNYINEYRDIGELYHVTYQNRDTLPRIIVSNLERQLKR